MVVKIVDSGNEFTDYSTIQPKPMAQLTVESVNDTPFISVRSSADFPGLTEDDSDTAAATESEESENSPSVVTGSLTVQEADNSDSVTVTVSDVIVSRPGLEG